MITQNELHQLEGTDVYGVNGAKIGTVGQVYLDDRSGTPEWASVRTGLFGMKESFVPLSDARFSGERIEVPFDKDRVKGAPQINPDGDLDAAEEDELYTYYGRTSTDTTEVDRSAGYDTSGPTTDEAMTRSEERLNVSTRSEQTGKARLRKYVVTEQQNVTVPVSREEVHIEREPITDANVDAAMDGPAISDEEHEVPLYAERPVVETETVPVERVRLGKQTVTEQQTAGGEVRKEQIEFEGDTSPRN